jgi:hypothetical protein
MPQTVFLDPASGYPDANVAMVEQRVTRHFNLSHLRYAGGASPFDQITAGEYTFGLAILVNKNLAGQDTSNADEQWNLLRSGVDDARPKSNYSGIHRARIYAGNVTWKTHL